VRERIRTCSSRPQHTTSDRPSWFSMHHRQQLNLYRLPPGTLSDAASLSTEVRLAPSTLATTESLKVMSSSCDEHIHAKHDINAPSILA